MKILKKQHTINQFPSYEEFIKTFKQSTISYKIKNGIIKIDTELYEIYNRDEDNLLFNKTCVFTGKLEKMLRQDAMAIVNAIGGLVSDRITQTSNYLILGDYDYCNSIKEGKSNKYKKAEELIRKGYDITIISENVFYELIKEAQND